MDLGEGPKVLDVDFSILDPKHRWFDRIDTRAANWGDDPYTTLSVTVRKSRVYDLVSNYRNLAYFNNLPSFANPLAPAGFNEQSFDIRRRNTSATLDLRPGKRITPYLAFDRNSDHGHIGERQDRRA